MGARPHSSFLSVRTSVWWPFLRLGLEKADLDVNSMLYSAFRMLSPSEAMKVQESPVVKEDVIFVKTASVAWVCRPSLWVGVPRHHVLGAGEEGLHWSVRRHASF